MYRHDEDEARIKQAFLITTSRLPTVDEAKAARQFLATQPSRYPGLTDAERRHRSLVDFCQTMLASSAFLYVE